MTAKQDVEALIEELTVRFVRCIGPCCENQRAMRKAADMLRSQADRLEQVYALPDLEWAEVGATLMMILADAARQGFKVRDTEAVAAIDKGKTYVLRLRTALSSSQAEVERLREGLELICGMGSNTDPWPVETGMRRVARAALKEPPL